MLPPRACKSSFRFSKNATNTQCFLDTFLGLNAVRTLSIIALLLVFASNIVTLVHDVQAVNRFVAAGKLVDEDPTSSNSTITDSFETTYIACVSVSRVYFVYILTQNNQR